MATLRDTILTELRLMGQRAYTVGMDAAAAATERLAAANVSVDKSAQAMGHQLNQSAFNMGNVIHMAGRLAFALGAVGTAAAYIGIKFDASMEQSQVAFTELLGSAGKANTMLQDLFELAARTPFEFPQLVDASQKLLGFGMNAKEVIPLMSKVGDAVAAVGADPERIDRITRALGQMQAKGKVYSEELLQLADAGLPAYRMLAEGLGVTGGKLNKMLRKGQVSAKQGLDILASQMDKRYSGMAEKQSKTFNGLISTIRDYSRMVLGQVMKPLFDYLEQKVLPKIAEVLEKIAKWGRSGGFERFQRNLSGAFQEGRTGGRDRALLTPDEHMGMAVKIGKTLGKVWGAVSKYFGQFLDALAPAKPFWDNVLGPFLKGLAVGAFGGFLNLLKFAIPVIKLFASILGWLGTKLRPFRGWFEKIGFVVGFVFGPGKIFGIAVKVLGRVGRVIGWVIKPFRWLIRIVAWLLRVFGRFVGYIFNKLIPAGHALEGPALRILGAWQKVKDFFLRFGSIIPQVAAVFYNFGKTIFSSIWAGIKAGLHGIGKAAGWVGKKLGLTGGGDPNAGTKNKGTGGAVPFDPTAPYRRAIPEAGSTYNPFRKKGAFDKPFEIHNNLYLDGKLVTKNVAKHTADNMARR
jgi:tape measure domain-containing protein